MAELYVWCGAMVVKELAINQTENIYDRLLECVYFISGHWVVVLAVNIGEYSRLKSC